MNLAPFMSRHCAYLSSRKYRQTWIERKGDGFNKSLRTKILSISVYIAEKYRQCKYWPISQSCENHMEMYVNALLKKQSYV